jgi:hypothetical protein
MKINVLFEKLVDENFLDQLDGELTLVNKEIIWTFDLIKNSEEYEDEFDDESDSEDEFESDIEYDISSPEELLNESYNKDVELIEEFIDEIDDINNWNFSPVETNKNTISFKIY